MSALRKIARPALLVLLGSWADPAIARAQSATPVLVKDIRPQLLSPASSRLGSLTPFRNRLYFAGDDGFVGSELWATDGTFEGTRLVADLCPGRCAGSPEQLVVAGDRLFFIANDPARGRRLWVTDGTSFGTLPLLDLPVGLGDPWLAAVDGRLVFLAPRGDGFALWRSDGTPSGTLAYFHLPSFEIPGDGERAPRVPALGERVYFDWAGPLKGRELWVSDGTRVGTGIVRNIGPGQRDGRICDRSPSPVVANGPIGFAADDGVSGCEPWWSDGTPAGTRRVGNLAPGAAASSPSSFRRFAGRSYFQAETPNSGVEMWSTDGTLAGTRRAFDLAPGSASSHAAPLAALDGRLVFRGDDRVHGSELWSTSGAPGDLRRISDLPSDGPREPVRVDDRLFFFSSEGGFDTLWVTRGSLASTRLVAQFRSDEFALETARAALGGRLFFAGDLGGGRGVELALSDGTPAGTRRIVDLNPGLRSGDPTQLTVVGDALYFVADDGVHGFEPWRSRGLRQSTALLADLTPGAGGFPFSYGLTPRGSDLLISDDRSLWRTVGGSLEPLHTDATGRFSMITQPLVLDGPTLFLTQSTRADDSASDLTLWRTEGTEIATPVAQVGTLEPSFFVFSAVAEVLPGRNRAFFIPSRNLDFTELFGGLYETDGTAAGTREVVPVLCGLCTAIRELVAAGDRLYLRTFSDLTPRRSAALWTTDGTVAGTLELAFVPDLFEQSAPQRLTPVGERLFFTADDFETGEELWVTDGSVAGTRRVVDLRPGLRPSYPRALTAFGNRLAFAADDGERGTELWITDGTAEGTERLADIFPGLRSSHPQNLRAIGDRLYFGADDGVHGLELWESDGTKGGTRLLADVMPGALPSDPREFTRLGGDLLFNAGRSATGYELWRLRLGASRD